MSIYGVVARIISCLTPIKKNNWIFGADLGRMYREGSRFLLEYMLKEHPDYNCTFITMNPSVKEMLDNKNIPCEMNTSFRGMIKVAQAEVVFTTQVATDICFVYKKKGRKFCYLSHGQPFKAVFLATPNDYAKRMFPEPKGLKKLYIKMIRFFVAGYYYWDSALYTSTSEFFVPYNKLYYGANSNVQILGMPRNDVLFDAEKMKEERWLDSINGKFVVTYMPTHRDYGHGKVCPIPFLSNTTVLQWMRANDVVLVVKQHPNMEIKSEGATYNDVIIDITKMKFEPQVCLYHSDVLITDYSSVWIDYLLLRRPLVFYYYDNFEKEDTGLLYDIKADPPGHICFNEDELFLLIKKIKMNYDYMRPSDSIVSKYHKYVDNKSCERVYKAITQL